MTVDPNLSAKSVTTVVNGKPTIPFLNFSEGEGSSGIYSDSIALSPRNNEIQLKKQNKIDHEGTFTVQQIQKSEKKKSRKRSLSALTSSFIDGLSQRGRTPRRNDDKVKPVVLGVKKPVQKDVIRTTTFKLEGLEDIDTLEQNDSACIRTRIEKTKTQRKRNKSDPQESPRSTTLTLPSVINDIKYNSDSQLKKHSSFPVVPKSPRQKIGKTITHKIFSSPRTKKKEVYPLRELNVLENGDSVLDLKEYTVDEFEKFSAEDLKKINDKALMGVKYGQLKKLTPRKWQSIYSKVSIEIINELFSLNNDKSNRCFKNIPLNILTQWVVYLFDNDVRSAVTESVRMDLFKYRFFENEINYDIAKLIQIFKNLNNNEYYSDDGFDEQVDLITVKKRLNRTLFLKCIRRTDLPSIVEYCLGDELDLIVQRCNTLKQVEMIYGIMSRKQDLVDDFFKPLSDLESKEFRKNLLYCKNNNKSKIFLAIKYYWNESPEVIAKAVRIGNLLTLPSEYSQFVKDRMIYNYCQLLSSQAWANIIPEMEPVNLVGLRKFNYLTTRQEFSAYVYMTYHSYIEVSQSTRCNPHLNENPTLSVIIEQKRLDEFYILNTLSPMIEMYEENQERIIKLEEENVKLREEVLKVTQKTQDICLEHKAETELLFKKIDIICQKSQEIQNNFENFTREFFEKIAQKSTEIGLSSSRIEKIELKTSNA